MKKSFQLVLLLCLLGFVQSFASAKDIKYARDFASLNAALASVGANETELIVSKATNVSSDLTVPQNVRLTIEDAGAFNIAAGKTLTVRSELKSPVKQIFFGGAVKFFFTPEVVYPEWFGATSQFENEAVPGTAVQTANVNAVNKAIASLWRSVIHIQLKGFGGTIGFQTGKYYYFNGTLDFSKQTGFFVKSTSNQTAKLFYTAPGTSPFISLDSAQRVVFHDLELVYTNAAYTGKLVKVGHAADWESDPVNIDFRRVTFSGTEASRRAAALLWFDTALISTVEDSRFYHAKVGVLGRGTNHLSSNIITVRNNIFTFISDAATKNPYQSWTIENNTVEAFGGGSWTLTALDPGFVSYGINIRGNWIGDIDKVQRVPAIQILSYGGVIEGNYITTSHTGVETAPAIQLLGGTQGVVISGNRFESPKKIEFLENCWGISLTSNDFSGADYKSSVVNPQFGIGLTVTGSYFGHEINGTVKLFDSFTLGGAGTPLYSILRGTVAVNPSAVSAGAASVQTFALPGAAVGDSVILNPPPTGLKTGLLVMQVQVSAANTVNVTFFNSTGGAIDEAAANWSYLIVR